MGPNRIGDPFFDRCRTHFPNMTAQETVTFEQNIVNLVNRKRMTSKEKAKLARAGIATVRRERLRVIEGKG